MQKQAPPPFAQQRIVFLALLLGMTMFLIVAGVVIQTNDGKGLAQPEPIELLNLVSLVAGATLAIGSFFVKGLMEKQIERYEDPNGDLEAQAAERQRLRFVSRLMPVAMLVV